MYTGHISRTLYCWTSFTADGFIHRDSGMGSENRFLNPTLSMGEACLFGGTSIPLLHELFAVPPQYL
jgi:hypothetical protein